MYITVGYKTTCISSRLLARGYLAVAVDNAENRVGLRAVADRERGRVVLVRAGAKDRVGAEAERSLHIPDVYQPYHGPCRRTSRPSMAGGVACVGN